MDYRKNLLVLFLSAAVLFASAFHTVKDRVPLKFNDQIKNIGLYLTKPREIKGLEITPDIVAWFDNWYGPISTNKLDILAKNMSATPFITWQPKDISLREIAAGKHDAYIESYLDEVTHHAKGMDVLIRFAHEMEMRPKYRDSWYSWQNEGPEAYIAAWRHVVSIGRKINPNIFWVWSPNRSDKYSEPFYPGDEHVDYVGITLNLRDHYEFHYETFREFYEKEGIRKHLESYGKMIIITEVAYSSEDKEEKTHYLRSIFDHYLDDPAIAGIVFFNDNIEEYRQYKITDDKQYKSEFFNGVRRIFDYRKENGLIRDESGWIQTK